MGDTVHFRVVYCSNFLNIGKQNCVTRKNDWYITFAKVRQCSRYFFIFALSIARICQTFGCKLGVNQLYMIERSIFRVWDPVTSNCLSLTLSSKVFIDSCCITYVWKYQSHLWSWLQKFFRIYDLNWKVRMCCEVPLFLCLNQLRSVKTNECLERLINIALI